ncbi:MAG TPA: CBS domain-containing protein [Rectinemataceae bacterium]|nr:CBS domain-containing protein [Rectinemataceae bacterium]
MSDTRRSLPPHLAGEPPRTRDEAKDLGTTLVARHIHRNFTRLDGGLTVREAVEIVQRERDESKIHYFYVVDDEGRLEGVMPTRRFLTRSPDSLLRDVCVRDPIVIPAESSLAEAAKVFESRRLLALPVVDRRGRIMGVLDLHVFAEREIDVSDAALREEAFQTIGIRVGGLIGAGPLRGFRLRFPWLLSTIAGGLLCVAVSSAFTKTLETSIVLALFLAPILALGESTAIQSMTLALQIVTHSAKDASKALLGLFREAGTGILLGAAAGAILSGIEMLWKGRGPEGPAIFLSVAIAMAIAATVGFGLPLLLYRLKVNLKVASGPIVLAFTDVATVLAYLVTASLLVAR